MLWGLHSLGFAQEAGDYYYFIEDVASGDRDLQVLYGIGGEREIEEHELPHLEGYESSQPVRVGNAAYNQNQHDVWGTLLDSVYIHTQNRDQLPESSWPILTRQVEQAIAHWRERDRGIWEVRGEPQHFTSSKVFCWLACDRGARLARLRGDIGQADRWQAAADEIREDVLPNGVDPREEAFVQHYETTALDASLLLLPLMHFLPGDDERIRNTVFAIADELTEDGLVLRYRVEETDDGLGSRRARSRSARSGWSARSSRSASSSAPTRCARSCSPTRARSASTPRRSTPRPGAISATSRRPSRTSR